MRIIGITGGIGSGKSTVSRVFESLGIPVFYADDVAKSVYNLYPEVLDQVVNFFGKDILDEDGKLNRSRLATNVFSSSSGLAELNAIVHPVVADEWQKWKKKHTQLPYLIREAAIMIETGSYRDCDEIILITSPENLRIERVMKRDNLSYTEVMNRIKNQWTDEKKEPFVNAVWKNDGKELLLPAILTAHKKWLMN